MRLNDIKKQILLATSSLMLVATLVVASFAWYKMSNGGNLKVDVPTDVGSAISFSFSSYKDVDGTLVPAKMKQGVINNWYFENDYTNGKYQESLLKLPVSRAVLPKTNEVLNQGRPVYEKYELLQDEDLGVKKMIPSSDYLQSPASIIYRQFSLRLGSTSNDVKKNAVFNIDVDYYDVLHHSIDDSGLHSLKQKDALSFSFYVFDSSINEGTLSELSTVVNKDASNKKTISEMFYDPLEKGRYVKTKDKICSRNKTYYTPTSIAKPTSVSIVAPDSFYYNAAADQYELCTTQEIADKDFYSLVPVSDPVNSNIGSYYERVDNRIYRFKANKANESYVIRQVEAETWTHANSADYNIIPYDSSTDDKFAMKVALEGLEFNKTYYVLTAVYYNVPDELLNGDLWLANKIDININYEIETLEIEDVSGD